METKSWKNIAKQILFRTSLWFIIQFLLHRKLNKKEFDNNKALNGYKEIKQNQGKILL